MCGGVLNRTLGFALPLLCLVLAPAGSAEQTRERFHYQLFCQGCHSPEGTGYRGVPALKDFVGFYLEEPEARAFLLRVPGVANAPLDDAALARLMNWIALRFAGSSLPATWQRYSAQEVAEFRGQRIDRLPQYRAALLERLRTDNPEIPEPALR